MNSYNQIHIKKTKLKEEQEQTRLRLSRLRETLKSKIDPDADDGAAELEAYENTVATIHTLEEKLTSLNDALQQLEKGSYGICERCGQPIDPDRLEALPETKFCMSCKIIIERESRLRANT